MIKVHVDLLFTDDEFTKVKRRFEELTDRKLSNEETITEFFYLPGDMCDLEDMRDKVASVVVEGR